MSIDCSFMHGEIAQLPLVVACDVVRSGALRIATPFVYPNGERIDVFIEQEADLAGELRLSDYGQTLGFLAEMGIKAWGTKRRADLIRSICESLDVSQVGDRLLIRIPASERHRIPAAIARLAQACIRASDLLFTARMSATTAFKERFEEFLSDFDFPYEPDVELSGPYDNVIRVDFRVRGARLSSIVNMLSGSNPASVSSAATSLFQKVHDLNKADYHQSNQILTIVDSDASVSEAAVHRFREYSTVLAFPESMDEVRAALAA